MAYLIWGAATTAIYFVVFNRRRRSNQLHHDARSRRDFLSALALFLTSLVSLISIVVLFIDPSTLVGVRGTLTVMALGAYTGAGIVMLQETPAEPEP